MKTIATSTHCTPKPPTCLQGRPSLTRYLPSEEMAMQRMWLLWPEGCPWVPFLARGITCSFRPVSTLPATKRGKRLLGRGTPLA